MQSCPRAALEMIEAEFFLKLLMRLFTDPAGLDSPGDVHDRCLGGKIGEMVFPLTVEAMRPHQRGVFARHMLCAGRPDPLWRAIGDAHAHSGEAGGQAAVGSPAPTDPTPFRRFKYRMGGS